MSDNVLCVKRCVRTSEVRNDSPMKTITNFGMDSESNIFVIGKLIAPLQEIAFSCFFYFFDTENI